MTGLSALDSVSGHMRFEDRKTALSHRLAKFGEGFWRPQFLAQFLAQVLHESGAFKHVREIWGPTKAQRGYEGRPDLGNTQPGDGKRYMGRDLIQITGRSNYRALGEWAGADFEAMPELLESPEWLGIGAIWFFVSRPRLMRYCAEGNNEMVTRTVNGGLNGFEDRLRWYTRTALVLLGRSPTDVVGFQKSVGLQADGIAGPLTRAALHRALARLPEASA